MASTDSMPVPRKNVAYRLTFAIYKNDGTLITGASGLDSEISKDGGTFTDCTNEATEIATSSGVYYLDLTSTEMNADCVALWIKTTSTGAVIPTFALYPQETGDIKVDVTSYGGTAGTFASGRPEVNTTHVGGTSQTARDIGASVLLSSGTGTGQVTLTSGRVNADITHISASAVTATGGRMEVNTTHWAGTAVGSTEVRANLINIAGAAVSTTTAQLGVNVVNAAGTAWGSGAITAAALASNAIALSKIATDTRNAFGLNLSGTLSGTHSDTTADLGASAPTHDVTGQTLFFPAHELARVITSYNTGTGVATFDSIGVTLANSDVWYLTATAPASASSAPTAAQIADAVWEEAIGDHSGTSGSTAEQLAAAGAAGDPWATALPGAYSAGTAGKIVGDNLTGNAYTRLGAPVGASISADIAAVKSQTAAIETDTQDLQTQIGTAGAGLTAADDAVMARLGAPAGASISADVAAVKSQTAAIETDTQDIQGRLPAALVNSRMDCTIDGTGMEAGAVTAVQSGLATQTSVDDLPTNAELATALAAADDAVLAQVALVKANTDKFANLPTVVSSGTGGQGFGAP